MMTSTSARRRTEVRSSQDATLSSTSSPPGDDPWPGERDPGPSDAERAYAQLGSQFLKSFEASLLASDEVVKTTTSIDNSFENFRQSSDYQGQSYPLILFSDFPETPPNEKLIPLIHAFHSLFMEKIPYLRSLPRAVFDRENCPRYLQLAVACMGSQVSCAVISANQLWWAASRLLTAGLEIDNREARKMDLLSAWVILETFGIMSNDMGIWKMTNIMHGHIETAARRIFLNLYRAKNVEKEVAGNSVAISDSPISTLAIYFILIDVLRALHCRIPTNITISELYIPIGSTTHDIGTIYNSLVVHSQAPPTDISSDYSLILLISILVDVNTLSTVFEPMNLFPAHASRNAKAHQGLQANLDTGRYQDPNLPFSISHEIRGTRQLLTNALRLWKTAYFTTANSDVLPFYHFTCMYLSFPGLFSLPMLVGYPSSHGTPLPITPHFPRRVAASDNQGQELGPQKAIQHAWLVLESLEKLTAEQLIAPWLPIVVFYASLVVWYMVCSDSTGRSHGSLRVLELFIIELRKMRWPCCHDMIFILENLMGR